MKHSQKRPSVFSSLAGNFFLGLYVLSAVFTSRPACAQPFINEFSNGTSGAKEFYELVVDGPQGGFQDIRGWIVDDHSGYFGCASGNGIASGHLRFANISNWECVRVGSIILIYNPADVNTAITAADDFTDANQDYVYILPINATGMFETSTSLPSSSNCNNYAGTLTLSGSGTTWNCIALGNNADAVQVVDPANTAATHHAVSYGSVNGPVAPIHFSGSGGGTNYSFTHATNDDYTLQVNWASGSASAFDTPGTPNNAANQTWLESLRSQPVLDTNAGCPPFLAVMQMTNLDASLLVTWDFGDGSATVQGDSVGHLYQNSGTYVAYVTVSNTSGCSYTDSAVITVGMPGLVFPPLAGQCTSDPPLNLSATPAGGTFFGTAVTGAQFDPAMAGTGTHLIGYAYNSGNCSDTLYQPVNVSAIPVVSIVPGNSGYLCEGDTVLLTATGSGPFSWSTGHTSTVIHAVSSGAYTVSVSNLCGTAHDTETLLFHPAPKAAVSTDVDPVICGEEEVELTASGGEAYQWSTGEQTAAITVGAAGTYSVTVFNQCGNDVTFVNVSEAEHSPFELKATKTALCRGESSVITLWGEYTDLLWSQGGTQPSITVSSPGVYAVSFTGACHEQQAAIEIRELPAPAVRILPGGPIGICPGELVDLSASHRGDLRWSTGSKADSISVSSPGVYYAESRNSCGIVYDSIEVYQYDLPEVQVHRQPEKAYAPADIHFVVSTGDEGEVLSWSVGGLTEQKGGNSFSGYFPEPGVDTVRVSLVDDHGCFFSRTVEVVTSSLVAIYIPNAFTPDGDGINDHFEVKGTGIYDLRMQIYDRWGALVYIAGEGTEHVTWDGVCGTGLCPEGVYSYLLEYATASGERQVRTGAITIVL